MRRFLAFPVVLSIMALGSAFIADSAGLWAKYVAPDGSYSFHYPAGWKVGGTASFITIDSYQTDEGLLVAQAPFDARKSPAELAAGFVALLKKNNPNLRAFNWQTEPKTAEVQVLFDLADQNGDRKYSGLGVLLKGKDQATWFSYFAPATGYAEQRGLDILQGLIASVASGSASRSPTIDYTAQPGANIDRNAQAFMFVLEFALGAPLTQAQESMILDELKSGWKTMSRDELKKYDQYPTLVQTILKMGQKDLEELRADLEKTIKEWIDESDQSDPAVKIIRAQLQIRGRVVIAGDPPLTEMSLAAYSEIIAFSRLLRQNPQASPEQLSPNAVSEVRKQVLQVWRSFSQKEQQGVATSPGLWICLRVLLREGSQAERERIQSQLLKLSAETSGGTGSGSGTAGQGAPMSMAAHNSLMAIQQMTFNSYMWSRGFNYQPATGRMW